MISQLQLPLTIVLAALGSLPFILFLIWLFYHALSGLKHSIINSTL